jgi:hypothetical protein
VPDVGDVNQPPRRNIGEDLSARSSVGELGDSIEQLALRIASSDGGKAGHVLAENHSGYAVIFVGKSTQRLAESREDIRAFAVASRGVESETPKHRGCVGSGFAPVDCGKDELVETGVGRGPLSEGELKHTHVPVHVHVVRVGALGCPIEPVAQEPMAELIATFVGKAMNEDVHPSDLSL